MGFLKMKNQLISREAIDKVRHIPAKIIQGRYDLVCPMETAWELSRNCLLYTSPSPRDREKSRMPSSA